MPSFKKSLIVEQFQGNYVKNKMMAKIWLHQLSRDSTFYGNALKNVYVRNEHFIENFYEVS